MATRLEIISKELIKPNSPTPRHLNHHTLSYLDQIHLPHDVSLVFFYTMPNIDNPFQISHQLKQSLSDVLTKYYPLAGRIHEADLLVDCNDAGALFVEAQFHALLTQAIQRTTVEEEELYHYPPMKPFAIWDATDRDVALGIQISFFECGGIAIGVCLSHKVADLMSLVTFVNAWAATCHGEKELVLQPMFDLGSHYFPPKHIPPFARETDETSAVVNEKLVTKRFLFDKEKLDELKALASSATNAEVKDPTRVEVVSAYISNILMKINQAKSSPKTMFAFSQPVNSRSRSTMSQHDQSFALGNFSALSLSASFMDKKDEKFHDLVSDFRTVTRKFNNYPEEDVVNNVVSANDPCTSKFTRRKYFFCPKFERS